MMRIRADQMKTLAEAAKTTWRVELERALTSEHPELRDVAAEAVGQALALQDSLHIEEFDHLLVLARLAALPGFPELRGRWGALLLPALRHTDIEAAGRMRLVCEELLPRIERELDASKAMGGT